MSLPSITYPKGPVPPHGIYHLLKGDRPEVSLQSYNDTICFYLMGGRAEVDRTRPESVQITGLTGLIPPWETVDMQGATDDGVTFIDALYGPIEVRANVVARGRDAKHTRRVVRHLIESIDVKQVSELGWWTHEMGYWWANVRWFKTAPDALSGNQKVQPLSLVLRADKGFWQSWEDTDSFGFQYDDMTDTFQYDRHVEQDLGANWPQYYTGTGGGYCYADGDRARWRDESGLFSDNRTVVNGPYKDFNTASDNQVVNIVIGTTPEWSTKSGANDLWARMGHDGDDWDGNGIRLRVTLNRIELSAWVDFAQIWERKLGGLTLQHPLPIIPHMGDKWTLIAGYEDDSRMFKVLRNGSVILSHKEVGTGSHLGSAYRGIGFGMRAGGAIITQATPSTVRKISAGDNLVSAQSGFLERRNAGDQDVYDDYILYGPATKIEIGNGPGSTDMVEFGPMAAGDVVMIRTDPRRKGVFDLKNISNATTPYLFGTKPSDTLYKKMNGRFFQNQIPAKQPGERVQPHLIPVSITGGNADTRVVASLTPLRRYPQ